MKRISYLLSLIFALAIVSCKGQEPDMPYEPTADFLLEVSDVTSTSCHFSVKPSDKEMSYVVMLVEKSEFDAFEDEYAYQDNDLEWCNTKALEEGKSLKEWLEGFLHKGDFEADEAGLMPESEYYL